MKRQISIFLAAILLIGWGLLPGTAAAAGADSAAGIVAVSSGRLNVRASASSSGKIVTALNKGQYVTLLGKSGSWWRVEYANGAYGYAHGGYISQVSGAWPAYIAVSSGGLNVRTGAGTGYAVQTVLPKGTGVVVLSAAGSWYRILYHGTKTGWVSAGYIRGYTQQSSAYPAVSLAVPSYKQTDSRWSAVRLGSSSATVGRQGCTVTCLAMTESWRTGGTVYPGTMAQRLQFTAGGALYWPGNYTVTTDSTNYMRVIYNKLQAGVPVIIGCRSAAGSTHWVTVTGFSGGNNLTAAGFRINDPGSASRTTLAEFFSSYQYFYKMAWYA